MTWHRIASRHDPPARRLHAALREADDIAALGSEALAGAEAQGGEEARIERVLRLLLDALDEEVPREILHDVGERMIGDRERQPGGELQALVGPGDPPPRIPARARKNRRPPGPRRAPGPGSHALSPGPAG